MSTRAQTVHAVVLRRRDLGESDRRLTLLTEELGVFDAIAKGARKGGSRLAGSSEPLSVSVLHLAIGKKQWYVTQAQPITSYPGLRLDFDRLQFALALAEVASAVFPHEQPAPEAFRFIVEALRYIEVHDEPIVAAVWAELQTLKLAGFAPQWLNCVSCDAPPKHARSTLSPDAGGFVCPEHADGGYDRFQVPVEVAIGLGRAADLEAPPAHFKLATEAYRALLPFWRHVAERPLPAREASGK